HCIDATGHLLTLRRIGELDDVLVHGAAPALTSLIEVVVAHDYVVAHGATIGWGKGADVLEAPMRAATLLRSAGQQRNLIAHFPVVLIPQERADERSGAGVRECSDRLGAGLHVPTTGPTRIKVGGHHEQLLGGTLIDLAK